LLTSTDFERVLEEAADARFASAGSSMGSGLDTADEQRAIEEIQKAYSRLSANPSLRSGDPDGVFTYEDPILAVAAYWSRLSEQASDLMAPAGSPPGADLKAGVRWQWIVTGVHAYLSRGEHTRVVLGGRTPAAPVTVDQESLRIAVVGDAGYAGLAQDNVIRLILDRHSQAAFDFVIHLGDVYFAGGIEEMTRNFLNPFSKIRNAGPRVFTLVGNHDLYYGGEAFLFALNILNQPGRYFVVESPQWRIACLDTSLGAERILGNDARLDEGQLDWLDSLLRRNDGKRLILMSHHFIVSGWEKPASSLSEQITARVKGKVFSWYWGHEHCAALYAKGEQGFHGACIGNGSFLEKWRPPNVSYTQPQWYPNGRCTCDKESKAHFWQHGFLELQISRQDVTETVWLEDGSHFARPLQLT
jgi:hypothetical protein